MWLSTKSFAQMKLEKYLFQGLEMVPLKCILGERKMRFFRLDKDTKCFFETMYGTNLTFFSVLRYMLKIYPARFTQK